MAQGYLLYGESTASMRALGEQLLFLLEGVAVDTTTPLFDGRMILPDITGGIGVDAAREAAAYLWQKPVRAPRKTIFIHGADAMTAQAQNAFLKIAEEPPEHGFLIMSVNHTEALLPTLVSRFQKVFVGPDKNALDDDPLGVHAAKLAKQFMAGDGRSRKAIIAEVLAEDDDGRVAPHLPQFIHHLMTECRKDPVKNFNLMKRLTDRWAKISQFNTNKKLQLETLI